MRHTLFGLLVLIKFIGDTYFKDCTDIIFGTNAHEIVKTNTVLILPDGEITSFKDMLIYLRRKLSTDWQRKKEALLLLSR